MGWKASLIHPFAKKISQKIDKQKATAITSQNSIFNYLLAKAVQTKFGKDHSFKDIKTHAEYCQAVPIRDYEAHRPYVDLILDGQRDVLWQALPKYLAKTSGTTSGVKYIPLTKDSLPNHFGTARNALLNYAHKTGNSSFFDGKMIFLSGSPALERKSNIPTGRLSGIANHLIPKWLKTNQLPSYETNIIEDWEEKLERIIDETIEADMRLISGIPPWVKMYFERLLERTGKSNIKEIFPNFSVFVHGGVNYEPYRANLESYMGPGVHTIETYPASEGFLAFQDAINEDGLILNTQSGIFYEFVPVQEISHANPTRLTIEDVEIGVNYAIILSSNAGLWAYKIGDTVEFVSKDPYLIKVTGRIAHFISAFGEHVIAKEVEQALKAAIQQHGGSVVEFTVAPQVNPPDGTTPYHEWLIEWEKKPEDITAFAKALDQSLQRQNIYYKDLIAGNILRPLVISTVASEGFINYMKSLGKLGGQNKVPRLSNDRKIASVLALQ